MSEGSFLLGACYRDESDCYTVDVSEVRLATVEVGVLSRLFTRSYTSQVVVLGFLNHQQYVCSFSENKCESRRGKRVLVAL